MKHFYLFIWAFFALQINTFFPAMAQQSLFNQIDSKSVGVSKDFSSFVKKKKEEFKTPNNHRSSNKKKKIKNTNVETSPPLRKVTKRDSLLSAKDTSVARADTLPIDSAEVNSALIIKNKIQSTDVSDTVELASIESSIKKIKNDSTTVPKSKKTEIIIPPQLIKSVVKKVQFNNFFGLSTNQKYKKEKFLNNEILPLDKENLLDSMVVEEVSIDSLPFDSNNANIVVSKKNNHTADTLESFELTHIEKNKAEKIPLAFDDVLESIVKNSNAINTPFKASSLISQKKKKIETLIGLQPNKQSVEKKEKLIGNSTLQAQKDTLLNSWKVASTQSDSLKLDTARVEVAENKSNNPKLDSVNQMDSTNYKLQKLKIVQNIENEVDKLVPTFNNNQFDKNNSTGGVGLLDESSNNDVTIPSLKAIEPDFKMDNVLGLNGIKLSSAKAQGFETVSFNDSTLIKMVDQLKREGKESYIKTSEKCNPEKYRKASEKRIASEQKKATSFIDNQEKVFSGSKNMVPKDLVNMSHRIIDKNILKGVDSLVYTKKLTQYKDLTRYKEKVKKSAEGQLKEIKIKEPKDFIGNSFTELDLSIRQFDASSLNITPKLGNHVLKQLDLGVGLNLQVPGSLSDVEKKIGYEVFSRFNIKKFLYLKAEGVALIPGMSNLEGNRETFNKAMLLGVGYVQKIGNMVALDMSIAHNPNQSLDLENYKGYQWKLKVGVRFYEQTKTSEAKEK